MKQQIPHMPLWVKDIDTDRDCRMMKDAEFGRYMRLLIRQWIEGSVPAYPTEAIRDACLDLDSLESVQSLLDRKFGMKKGGARCNPRCDEERSRVLAKLEVLRNNGKKGGEANARANALAGAYVSGSESSSGRRAFSCSDADAREIYALYPRKKHPAEAVKAIQKAALSLAARGVENPIEHLRAATAEYAASPYVRTTAKKYIPYPASWFNKGGYSDDRAEWRQDAADPKDPAAVADKLKRDEQYRASQEAARKAADEEARRLAAPADTAKRIIQEHRRTA